MWVNGRVAGAVWMVARSERRRQRWALMALAAIVALGFGAVARGVLGGVSHGPCVPGVHAPRAVTDLVVNPLFPTEEFANRLRELPHVRGLWTQDLLYAGVGEWRPMTAGEVATDNASGEGIGSVDGRYVEADRLMIDRGRAPTGAREVFVTESFRPQLDERMGHRVEIGEQIPVAFLYPGDVDSDLNDNFDPDKVVEPIGTERLRVSGFGRLPDEVFDDDLFPRQRFVVSRDIAEKYSCSGSIPDASIEVIRAALFPPDCSRTYRYWAIDVDDRANVSTVAQGITDITDDLNSRLPAALQEDPNGFRYFPILTTQSDLDARVQHAVQPTVVALVLFGVLAGVATLLLTLLASARNLRRSRPANETTKSLGMSQRARALAVTMPSAMAVSVGVVAAVIVGYLGSRVGPSGQVRRVEARASFSLPAAVALPIVGLFAVALGLSLVLLAIHAVRRRNRRPTSAGRLHGSILRGPNPAFADGVRSALSTTRGGAR